MNIWIVQASSGQYDDYCTWNIKAFSSQKAAQAWVDAQEPINHTALQELRSLIDEYEDLIEIPVGGFDTDEDWDKYDAAQTAAFEKAIAYVQIKYPDADLTISEDFHGYRVVEHPIDLEITFDNK
jgi:hypothetical protein